jgi:SpoVK/Ycf46/Vps4 family AAA+-type ATPase
MREKSGFILHKGRELKRRPKACWDDLILNDELKEDIRCNIELFFNRRGFFEKHNIPYKRGFLFVGPPGNGKSLLCRVIAGSYPEIPFIYYQQEMGDSCYELERCFKLGMSLAPSIICIEDIDVIITERNLSLTLNLIDGLSEYEGILLIATTNHPEKLDQNILNRPSRFDRIWVISPPDEEIRLRILKKFMGNFFDDKTLREIAMLTEGFSMTYMKELFISSFINAIEKGSEKIILEDVQYAMNMLKGQLMRGNNYYQKSKQLGFIEGINDNALC